MVKVNDYQRLERSIRELCEDKKLVIKIKKWQERRVRDFKWDKIIKKFIKYAKDVGK